MRLWAVWAVWADCRHLELVSQPRIRGEEPQRNQRAGEVEQAGEDVGAALVAGGEAAVAEEPSDRALHDPAVPTEALGRLDALAGR